MRLNKASRGNCFKPGKGEIARSAQPRSQYACVAVRYDFWVTRWAGATEERERQRLKITPTAEMWSKAEVCADGTVKFREWPSSYAFEVARYSILKWEAAAGRRAKRVRSSVNC